MKIIRRTSAILIIPFFILFQTCDTLVYKRGNGEMVVHTRYPDDFEEIVISGNYEVFLEAGEDPKVVINVDENLLEYIEVESGQNILSVYSTEKIRSSDGIKIYITYRNLNRILNSGASAIFTDSPLTSERLKLSLSGAGMMELDMEVSELEIKLSGAGYIRLSGSADRLEISMSGAGSLEAYDLETKDCDVSISGVGGAKVNVSGTLIASVSGVGGIRYRGNPAHITRNVSGLGKIRAADEENR